MATAKITASQLALVHVLASSEQQYLEGFGWKLLPSMAEGAPKLYIDPTTQDKVQHDRAIEIQKARVVTLTER